MNFLKSKSLRFLIILIALGYFLKSNFDLNRLSSIKNTLLNYTKTNYSNNSIPVYIKINKEKELKIDNQLINQTDFSNKISHKINTLSQNKKVNTVILHLYVDNSISKGYINDLLHEFCLKHESKIKIKIVLHAYQV